jgi:hypothetical protein
VHTLHNHPAVHGSGLDLPRSIASLLSIAAAGNNSGGCCVLFERPSETKVSQLEHFGHFVTLNPIYSSDTVEYRGLHI